MHDDIGAELQRGRWNTGDIKVLSTTEDPNLPLLADFSDSLIR